MALETRSGTPSIITDLERRVLAHERILQSLIAYMSLAEPRFIKHLKSRFVDPMGTARREHDYRDVDDYAEEFIRAVMALGDARLPARADPGASGGDRARPQAGLPAEPPETPPRRPDRVRIRDRNGVWELRVDQVFHGDYHRREHAVAAGALALLASNSNKISGTDKIPGNH